MRKRRRIALLAFAVAAISVAGATAAFAGDNDSGFKTSQPSMLTLSQLWQGHRPDPDRRRHAARAATGSRPFPTGSRSARAARDESTCSSTTRRQGRRSRTPTASADRGELAERLRQRPGEPAEPQPAQHGRALRVVCDRLRARTTSDSAPTTSRPRRRDSTATSSSPTRKRQDYVLPQEALVAASDCGRHCRRGAERRRRGDDSADRQAQDRSTAWAGTTTRTTSRSPASTTSVVLSGDDTFFTSGPLTGAPSQPMYAPRSRSSTSYIAPSTDAVLGDTGRSLGVRLRQPASTTTTTSTPGSTAGRQRTLHQGAEDRSRRATSRTEPRSRRTRSGVPAASDERQLADRPAIVDAAGHRRASVGARILERHQQRVPVRPHRGHRVRQAPGNVQRRLRRRLGPWHGRSVAGRPLDERSDLEDGVRSQAIRRRSTRSRSSSKVTTTRSKTPHRDPSAGQRRDDGRTGCWSRRIRAAANSSRRPAAPTLRPRPRAAWTSPSRAAAESWRRSTSRPTRSDATRTVSPTPGASARGSRVASSTRRRIGTRLVPRRHPGAHALGREAPGPERQRRRHPGLHVQAGRRSAAADADSGC